MVILYHSVHIGPSETFMTVFQHTVSDVLLHWGSIGFVTVINITLNPYAAGG